MLSLEPQIFTENLAGGLGLRELLGLRVHLREYI